MNQVMEQIRAQIKSEVQNQSQAQAKMVQPQVQALVQSVIGPLMPEIEQMAQARAQTLAPALNSYIDSNIGGVMKGIMPLLPPDAKKLPASEIESLIRQSIEDELKPQIMAAIEDEVQSIVQDRIIAPIHGKVAEMVRAQLAGVRSQVAKALDALLAGQFSGLPMGADIKNIIQESVDSVEACVLSDVETMFRTSVPKKFLISVMVNGKPVSYDVIPVVKDGRTLVPLRAIAQSMGAQVQWNDQSQTITLSRGDKTINLGIGDTTASVNNSRVSLDVPATIVNGRTLVPARFISESLGGQVSWDQSSKTASIVSKQ
jgi:BMFP domain-containing protein YqiC